MEACFATVMAGEVDLTIMVLDYPHEGMAGRGQWDAAIDAFIAAGSVAAPGRPWSAPCPKPSPRPVRDRLMAAGIAPLQGLDGLAAALRCAARHGARGAAPLDAPLFVPPPATLPSPDEKPWCSTSGPPSAGWRTGAAHPRGTIGCDCRRGRPPPARWISGCRQGGGERARPQERGAGGAARSRLGCGGPRCRGRIPGIRGARRAHGRGRGRGVDCRRQARPALRLLVAARLGRVSRRCRRRQRHPAAAGWSRRNRGGAGELAGGSAVERVSGRALGDRYAAIEAVLALAAFAEWHRERLFDLEVNPLAVLGEGQGAVVLDAVMRIAGD